MPRMDDAPRLDHGAIGNGRVLALVSPSSRIDWLCLPRFDSPSVFAGILDPDRGGDFGFEVEGLLRGYAFRDGAFVDSYAMARLR